MEDTRIEEIVCKVFEKAKHKCASHSKYALSKHISVETNLSSKTLERAYDRYINKRKKHGSPHPENVDILCGYLEFEDYQNYVESNPVDNQQTLDIPQEMGDSEGKKNTKGKHVLTISISIAFGMALLIGLAPKILSITTGNLSEKSCMTWAKTHFEKVDCGIKLYSDYGTPIVPYDAKMKENFKKVEVTGAYKFFTEENQKPLVWYYKTKSGEIEYYTAPGLHPINGETLRKITEYIIEKYVSIHNDIDGPFVDAEIIADSVSKTQTPKMKDTDNMEMVILIFDGNILDNKVIRHLGKTTFKSYSLISNPLTATQLEANKQQLLSGNLSDVNRLVPSNVEYVSVGSVEYTYREGIVSNKLFTCDMVLNFDVFLKSSGERINALSKSVVIHGAGFSKALAKQNAVEKVGDTVVVL